MACVLHVLNCVLEFCNIVIKDMLPNYIRWTDDIKLVVMFFKNCYDAQQCVDAENGFHIPVTATDSFHKTTTTSIPFYYFTSGCRWQNTFLGYISWLYTIICCILLAEWGGMGNYTAKIKRTSRAVMYDITWLVTQPGPGRTGLWSHSRHRWVKCWKTYLQS